MIELRSFKDLTRLRRVALQRQGLLRQQPFGRGITAARLAIRHLGYVQIDSISVIERAHHHVLYSRVPTYQPGMLNQLLQRREIFEYWSHAAAFLPIEDYRFSLPYKQAVKSGQTHWFKNPDTRRMARLLERIRLDGPLRTRDLDNPAQQRGGWWDWKPDKQAIEQLYMQGDVMVSDREGFQKTYDLTERVLPDSVDQRLPGVDEFAAHLLQQHLRCHGVVTAKQLTYQRRNRTLRTAMTLQLESLLASQTLQKLRLPDGEIVYAESHMLEQPLPRQSPRLRILSPFDNSVIVRDRLRSLFDFNYQIECYLPAAKRQYGYFCLPLLYRDAFIGRIDCKAHRSQRLLEIKTLQLDAAPEDELHFIAALSDALADFCLFQCCDLWTVSAIAGGTASLRRALINTANNP